jgi:type VI secretion system protein ImpA
MSDELQKPAVIDIDAMLQPVSEESPSGESLRYSGLYDEITEARRADDDLNQGEWQTELKTADYKKVIDLSVNALTTRTRDLQIAAWLSDALIKQYGFVGLRDSMKLLSGLQMNFWDTLHPEVDEGDMEGRANAIAWFEAQASDSVKTIPYTAGGGYTFRDWEGLKAADAAETPENNEWGEQSDQSESQTGGVRRVNSEMWRKAISVTRRAQCEEINFAVEECWVEFQNLNKSIEEKYDRNQMPGLSNLKKSLEAVHEQIKKLLEQKRKEEPDESDLPAEGAGINEDGTPRAGVSTGAISSRRDALRRLDEIADFFHRTEPHSPISYIVQRAVKWGNMPLELWLQDVIKDETVLYNLRQTLGISTDGGPGYEGEYDSSSYSTSEEAPPESDASW